MGIIKTVYNVYLEIHFKYFPIKYHVFVVDACKETETSNSHAIPVHCFNKAKLSNSDLEIFQFPAKQKSIALFFFFLRAAFTHRNTQK